MGQPKKVGSCCSIKPDTRKPNSYGYLVLVKRKKPFHKTMANPEVFCSNAQPFHKAMDPELLEVAILGDKRSLDELLQ